MPQTLAKRFAAWIGTWRGTTNLITGEDGICEFKLEPLFDGNCIQVTLTNYTTDKLAIHSRAFGLWGMSRDGKVRTASYGEPVGFLASVEAPDDPDSLALEGTLSEGRKITTVISMEGAELIISSSIGEGYTTQQRPRFNLRMRRMGGAP
ncbi:MAG: hypothetical protein KF696_11540 [Planctomycetes bacterium]|nr:hypothetical protein [Planctomycetota bacterium]MCW8135226.1 hypothetical protein [Planctomycetota bacterium]